MKEEFNKLTNEELKEVFEEHRKVDEESRKTVIEVVKKIKEEKKKELKPTPALSPSKINTYFKCPRDFFYTYVEKRKAEPNIHLVKGSVVHKVLENFYLKYNDKPKKLLSELFKKFWNRYKKMIDYIDMTPKEVKAHKKDALTMIMNFYEVHNRKMQGVIIQGKAENEQHAFYLTKPKFSELYVKDDDLKVRGYIDRIHTDYNGMITLADYKTSSRYGVGLGEDYKRQLSIYALLYNNQEKKMADFVSVIFLRYGEEVLLEVTPTLLKYARDTIDYVWGKTRSAAIKDYPLKEGKLCGWCSFLPICSGEKEFKKEKNKKKIIALSKEMKKDETKNN